jgi:diadenosine tetraphosphatase ApaH/serine/threonine PP2A family protein phosphatase
MKSMEVFIKESNVIEIQSPVTVVGDIHGQLFDLFQMFKATAPNGLENKKYLFLGDYVDRGRYSLITFAYLAALKLKYPDNFYFIRGNHESRMVNQMNGFYNECMALYGHAGVWNLVNSCFDTLPIAALVDNEYFCVHGGLSPKVALIESLSLVYRFQEIPTHGPISDVIWGMPEDVDNWHENQRGSGYLFGKKQVETFCQNNELKMIVRTHQMIPEGYKWQFDNKLCTVWSAPNYMNIGNKASVMNIVNGSAEMQMFERCPDSERKIPETYIQHQYC